MLSSAGRVGPFGGPERSVSCGENLIFYSVFCSIQSGNASSLGRPSKEHQIITYQLDYVIIRIGFLLDSPKPKRVRVWPSVKRSERQKADGILVSERFCLDQWLMASPNYSPSLSLSGSFVSRLTVDFWRSVFALQSVASIFTFSSKLEKNEKKNSWKELKWSSDNSDTK